MNRPDKALTKKINDSARKINNQMEKTFAQTDHRLVLQEMSERPAVLEKFQLQCLSLATFALSGKMDDISESFNKAAVGAAQLVAVIKAGDDIVKGN